MVVVQHKHRWRLVDHELSSNFYWFACNCESRCVITKLGFHKGWFFTSVEFEYLPVVSVNYRERGEVAPSQVLSAFVRKAIEEGPDP
jgi:hypothetical protein